MIEGSQDIEDDDEDDEDYWSFLDTVPLYDNKLDAVMRLCMYKNS